MKFLESLSGQDKLVIVGLMVIIFCSGIFLGLFFYPEQLIYNLENPNPADCFVNIIDDNDIGWSFPLSNLTYYGFGKCDTLKSVCGNMTGSDIIMEGNITVTQFGLPCEWEDNKCTCYAKAGIKK
jgi:hypothetical protein